MGAVLAILGNPVVSKLTGKVIDKLFNRKGKNAPVYDKVAAAATSGVFVSVALTVVGFFWGPELVEALQAAGIESVVSSIIALVGVITVFIQTMVGYFKEEG